MKSTVFIHTSCHEILAAKVAIYSHIRASKNLDKFDIKLIRLEDYPFILKYHDHRLIRNNKEAAWYKDVPQSFLPLRFLVPQIMGYEGRAVLTDPDIFAIADVYELLTYDMGDKAILSRPRPHRGKLKGYNSSVMVLNCSKLNIGSGKARSMNYLPVSLTSKIGSHCAQSQKKPLAILRKSGIIMIP